MARLPHGARGIELADFALEEGKDKLVLIKQAAAQHYTLHAGTASDIMGVHRTWTHEARCNMLSQMGESYGMESN